MRRLPACDLAGNTRATTSIAFVRPLLCRRIGQCPDSGFLVREFRMRLHTPRQPNISVPGPRGTHPQASIEVEVGAGNSTGGNRSRVDTMWNCRGKRR